MGFVPCIPIVLDRGSAELIESFPGLVLPDGYLDSILSAGDPRAAGIAAAIELGHRFLAVPGVVGVNLSGGSVAGRETAFAEGLAAIGTGLSV